MRTNEGPWKTAEEVRAENLQLDARLLDLLDRVPPDRLHAGPDGEWTLAENLAHIAEFPDFFAQQLQGWLAGEQVVVGRVAEHDAGRNDAIFRAAESNLTGFRSQITAACERLRLVLEELTDEHLGTTMQNVKYGPEPMTAYLARYVVGHKAAHVTQLEATIAAATSTEQRSNGGSTGASV